MLLSKNVQYGIVGALAVYVVFFTRPAPLFLVNLLSNPLAQLAVLGAVVYVGAKVSLLVALVAAVAVVLTIPAREFMDNKKDKKGKKDKKDKSKPKLNLPSELSTVAGAVAASSEPAPGADAVATLPPTTGSETFSLHDAAPF